MAKSKAKNKTIAGNVAAILGTLGTVVSMFQMHVPTEIIIPAISSAGGAIAGNIFSIWAVIKGAAGNGQLPN